MIFLIQFYTLLMKKILVPTDFSKEAENATKVAAQLAKKHNYEIILLHMLEIPMYQSENGSSPTDLPEAMYFMKLAHNQFEEVMDKDYLNDVTVHEMVHGADGFKEMFIGSNTEKVIRVSDTPVLVIKNEHEHFDINDFVFASDFKNDNKETYNQAVKLAEAFGSKVHLLMVNTMSNFTTTAKAKVRIMEFIEGNPFKNYTINIYNDMTVEKGILNFSHIINADLIGISTHGRQGIAHFFSGSISEDLVNHANRPVITFKI